MVIRHASYCNQLIGRPGIFYQTVRYLNTDISNWYKPYGIETDLRIYNCVAKRKVPFILTNPNYITWYTCGPTVYDSCHLGHASCYVKLDIIQRILKHHFQLNIVTAMNITDIDDKIIARSREANRNWLDLSRQYETEFWHDLKQLNVMEPNIKVRVSEHIPKILNFIENMVYSKQAYVGKDNSVYFNVECYKAYYGKLQNIGNNVSDTTIEKESSRDFALWKACKTENEPSWPSPWGNGRPGWHIECSTLASMIFGSNVQVHAGGLDLRFPHHENEEAQSCSYHKTKQWVNYWIHTGQLNLKGQRSMKMSKSLKNTISIGEMLSKYTADDFRMACTLSNYRNAMEYSDELMETAKNILNKFQAFNSDCLAYLEGKKTASGLDDSAIMQNLHFTRSHIDAYIRDDFDTAHCITTLLDQISSISRCINTISKDTNNIQTASSLDAVAAINNYVQYILESFGFACTFTSKNELLMNLDENLNINNLLEDILGARKVIRQRALANKSQELFQICDDLRDCLRQHGIDVQDHSQGSSWKFIMK